MSASFVIANEPASNEIAKDHFSDTTVDHSVGIARDATNTILYIEHHQYFGDGSHIARYFSPDLQLKLEKHLSYPALSQHPDIQQYNYLSTQKITVRNTRNGLEVVRSDPGQKLNFTMEKAADIIMDAGFDSFIRANWSTLQVHDPMRLRLAVAGNPRLIKVILTTLKSDDSGKIISIQPANWLVRLMIPEITLAYDVDQRLRLYEGPPNRSLVSMDTKSVTIGFRLYQHHKQLDTPLSQWLRE